MIFGKIHIKDKEKLKYKNLKYFTVTDDFIEDEKYKNIFIGFSEVRRMYGDDVILSFEVNKNVRWMYSYNERIQEFNEDLPVMLDKLIVEIVHEKEYEFVDPIVDELYSDLKLASVLPNNLLTVVNENMIYSYSESTDIIYGFNLDYLTDLNINVVSFMGLLKNKSKIFEMFDKVEVPDLDLEPKYYPLFL